MKRPNNHMFYHRFVNEEKLREIGDIKIQRNYFVYTFSLAFFCLGVATYPSFVGYNFQSPFIMTFFCVTLFFAFWLIYFSVRFIQLDNKYHIVKNRKFMFMIPMGYIVLAFIFSFLAIFTVEVTVYPDTSFNVRAITWPYFLIFWPLYLIHFSFVFFACMKCFAKYVRE